MRSRSLNSWAFLLGSIVVFAGFALAGSPPATTEPADTQSGDHIMSGDKLSISVNGLVGVGVVSVLTPVVNKDGEIKMPLIGQVKIDGLTSDQAQKEIARAYKDANVLTNAQVGVSWVSHADR
jgi:protein involved in polysaccharide export with SLBB domain